MTQKEISNELGISQSRVSQIIKKCGSNDIDDIRNYHNKSKTGVKLNRKKRRAPDGFIFKNEAVKIVGYSIVQKYYKNKKYITSDDLEFLKTVSTRYAKAHGKYTVKTLAKEIGISFQRIYQVFDIPERILSKEMENKIRERFNDSKNNR